MVQAQRLPVVSGDSGSWGTVLNNYLLTEHNQNGSHRNITVYDDFNVVNATNNETLLIVNSSNGRVGIGTSSPTEKLTLSAGNLLQETGDPKIKGAIINTEYMSNAQKVYVSGKYAYVASLGSDTISIIDVSDPENPALIGSVTDSVAIDNPTGVMVAGKYAYVVGENSDTFAVIDVSDSRTPTIVSNFSDHTNLDRAQNVYVSGKYAYVTGVNSDNLAIIDISDHTNPKIVGNVADSTNLDRAEMAYVVGEFAYVAVNLKDRLTIVNVSDPTTPKVIGSVADSTYMDGAKEVYVSGSYAYVAGANSDSLAIVNITNKTNPTFISGLINTTYLDGARGIHVAGKYAYLVGANSESVGVVDISDVSNPRMVGGLIDSTYLTGASSIFVSGKYAYATGNNDAALSVIDITGIDAPAANIGNIFASDVTVSNNVDIGNSLYVRNGLNLGPGGLFVDSGEVAIHTDSGDSAFSLMQRGIGDILNIFDGNSEIFTIIDGGKVGIGVASPNQELHVIGNVTINDSVTDGAIQIDSTNDFISFTGENGSLYQPTYGSDDGLVLYLPFSENAVNVSNTTYDRSPYGNDGTLTNMNDGNPNSTWVIGKNGLAMNFDGKNDYVTIADHDSLDIGYSDFTVSLWLKFNDVYSEQYPLAKGLANNDNTVGYEIRAGVATPNFSDAFDFVFGKDNGGADSEKRVNTNIRDLVVGQWYYFAVTGDRDGLMKLYKNGKLVQDGTNNVDISSYESEDISSTRPVDLGRRHGDGGYFNGSMDEVMIYKRALTADEVRLHYLRGSGFGASGAITADKFRVLNTSGSRILEINQTSFDVKNKSGDTALYVNKVTGRVGIGTAAPTKDLHVLGDANISGRLDVGTLNITGVTFSQGDLDVSGSLRVAGGSNISGDLGVSGRVGVGTLTPATELEVEGGVNISGGLNVTNGDVLLATSGGSVGIGTTKPGMKLVVSGNVNVSQNLTVNNSVLFVEGTSGRVGIGTLSPNQVLEVVGDILLNTTAEREFFFDASSGEIGIGTTSPSADLHIQGPSGDKIMLESTESNGRQFVLDSEVVGSDQSFTVIDRTGNIRRMTIDQFGFVKIGGRISGISQSDPPYVFGVHPQSSGNALFVVQNDTGNVGIGNIKPSEKLEVEGNLSVKSNLVVTTAGKVGIGTASPVTTLDVKGKANFTGNISVGETSNILFVDNTSGNVGIGTNNPDFNIEVVGNLSVSSSSGNGGDRFIIDSSGSLGINTTIPNATLHLTGTLNVSAQTRVDTDLGVMPDGGIVMDNLLSASASTDININSDNELHKVTSSKRFKEKIRDIELNTNLIYDLMPRTFVWNNESGSYGLTDFGLVAEEVDNVLPELVSYDGFDEPYSVKYGMLSVFLLKEIQDLKKEIDQLEVGANIGEFEDVNGSIIVRLG